MASKCRNYKITPAFRLALLQHSWPGNVRELLSLLELAKTRSKNSRLTLDHLELDFSFPPTLGGQEEGDAEREIYRVLADILGQRGLMKGAGLNKEMARLLSESEPTVSRKTRKYLDSE